MFSQMHVQVNYLLILILIIIIFIFQLAWIHERYNEKSQNQMEVKDKKILTSLLDLISLQLFYEICFCEMRDNN